jgi:hypothetical protein
MSLVRKLEGPQGVRPLALLPLSPTAAKAARGVTAHTRAEPPVQAVQDAAQAAALLPDGLSRLEKLVAVQVQAAQAGRAAGLQAMAAASQGGSASTLVSCLLGGGPELSRMPASRPPCLLQLSKLPGLHFLAPGLFPSVPP